MDRNLKQMKRDGNPMEYGQISSLSKPVSKLVFGTAMPSISAATRSKHEGEPGFLPALNNAFSLLDIMFSLGVNTFDCAAHYGEEVLGEWMAKNNKRDQVIILTKGGHHNQWRKRMTAYDVQSDFYDSLVKLKTDHVDIYLLHRDDPEIPVDGIVDLLNQLHNDGRISAFGGSNWTHKRLDEANNYAARNGLMPFTVSSPNFGLANQVKDPWGGGCVTISGQAEKDARNWYEKQQMPVFAYSCLARGFFSGKLKSEMPDRIYEILDQAALKGYNYPENFERLRRTEILAVEKNTTVPMIAMAFIFSSPMKVFAVISPNSGEHMQSNIQAQSLKLTEKERKWLDLETDER
jgi:aryl-alcohol dehydrogenase-like predicted oxidoreductase